MGGLSGSATADTNIVQSFAPGTNQIHGGPVWWDGPDGSYAYIQPASDYLQQYKFNRATGKFLLPGLCAKPYHGRQRSTRCDPSRLGQRHQCRHRHRVGVAQPCG